MELAHTARYQGNIIEGTDFRGTFPAYLTVYSNATMKAGRFFTEAENEHRDNVVVIGENVAKAFFPSIDDALGKEILVDGSHVHRYRRVREAARRLRHRR